MEAQEFTLVIRRPVSEVFAYLDDIEREREWQPNLREVEQVPPGPSSVGTRKRYVSEFMGKRVENTYEVVEMGPGWRVVYRSTPDSALDATTEVRCEADGESTRVTMRVSGRPTGALRLLPARLVEKTSRDELVASLERLKNVLEG